MRPLPVSDRLNPERSEARRLAELTDLRRALGTASRPGVAGERNRLELRAGLGWHESDHLATGWYSALLAAALSKASELPTGGLTSSHFSPSASKALRACPRK